MSHWEKQYQELLNPQFNFFTDYLPGIIIVGLLWYWWHKAKP